MRPREEGHRGHVARQAIEIESIASGDFKKVVEIVPEEDAGTDILYDSIHDVPELVPVTAVTKEQRDQDYVAAMALVGMKTESIRQAHFEDAALPDEAHSILSEILEGEMLMVENPRLAEYRGVTSTLIREGLHVPSGSTTEPAKFDIEPKQSTKRFDHRDKPRDGLDGHKGYVVISGSFKQAKELLQSFADARAIPSLIAEEKGREIGLVDALNKSEAARLAQLGATYYTAGGTPIGNFSTKAILPRVTLDM